MGRRCCSASTGARPSVPRRLPSEPKLVLAAETGQLALFEGSGESLPPPAPRLRELTAVPDPPLHGVTRLSFSAVALFERCSYRYYAERVAGMRPVDRGRDGDGAAGGLHPTEIGDAVHRLLERVDLAHPAEPEDLDQLVRGWYPAISDAEVEHVSRHVRAYCESSLARRIAALENVHVERPFAFELDGVLLNGRLDVLARSGTHALVLDYKTNALDGREPSAIVDAEYRLQQTVYALACFRAGAGGSRSSTSFSRRPTRSSRRRSGRTRSRGSSVSSGRRSRASATGTSTRRRARSPAPAARPSAGSAQGRARRRLGRRRGQELTAAG